LAECHDIIYLETFFGKIDKVVAIAKEHLSLDAPMIVDEVGIVEIDAPSFALGWKTAQEKHFGICWQKGYQRMILHVTATATYILCVKITLCHS
jgi:hypothetical protein